MSKPPADSNVIHVDFRAIDVDKELAKAFEPWCKGYCEWHLDVETAWRVANFYERITGDISPGLIKMAFSEGPEYLGLSDEDRWVCDWLTPYLEMYEEQIIADIGLFCGFSLEMIENGVALYHDEDFELNDVTRFIQSLLNLFGSADTVLVQSIIYDNESPSLRVRFTSISADWVRHQDAEDLKNSHGDANEFQITHYLVKLKSPGQISQHTVLLEAENEVPPEEVCQVLVDYFEQTQAIGDDLILDTSFLSPLEWTQLSPHLDVVALRDGAIIRLGEEEITELPDTYKT